MSDQANSHVLFLFALSDNALATIKHKANRHLRPTSKHDHYREDELLDIGKVVPKQSNGFTIARIGRGPDAEIRVQAVKEADLQSVSGIQCSIERSSHGGCLLLFDRSSHRSTQLHGDTNTGFCEEPGAGTRQVAMRPGLNEVFSFGGPNHDLFIFRVIWSSNAILSPMMQARPAVAVAPDMARTIEPIDEDATPENGALFKPRCETGRALRVELCGPALGSGSFATVWRGVDVDEGRLIAVKVHNRASVWNQREAQFLAQLKHVSGSNCLASALTVSSHTLSNFLDLPRVQYTWSSWMAR